MKISIDIIIYFMKSIILNIYTYFCFIKISNNKSKSSRNLFLIIGLSLIFSIICTYIEFFIDSFIAVIILCLSYGCLLGKITRNRMGYSIIITIISYAICTIFYVASVIIEYIFYDKIGIDNYYLNFIIIVIIQSILLFRFLKIKRFKNGFDFLYKKLNNDFSDIVMINISTAVILIYCLIGTIYDDITKNLLIAFIILGFTMLLLIYKTFIIYNKQRIFENTLKEYEDELSNKKEEIEKLRNEKFNISKITHEFYNRQKALELLVKENMDTKNNIVEENVNKNVLTIIKSLTNEYSEELKKIKNLSKLEEAEIPEIDNMFKYMQSECSKNNIEFKLKIIGNIHPLINNVIPKNKLETLIGDHLRDAINAVNSAKTENKEILAILGIKEKKYELSIYDTGIEFEIETLIKLGLEAITTYANKGGTGIGFLTTFETMRQTKASLIITEQPVDKESYYTKSVTIRFDGKNQYKICSYRADEIKKHSDNKRIIIEKI